MDTSPQNIPPQDTSPREVRPSGIQQPIGPIDVVIPAFNAERWIPEALASVWSKPWIRSVVVVDDGSTVRLESSIGHLVEASPIPTTILRRDNGGESAARNTGIDFLLGRENDDAPGAAGGYVLFFDADDLLLDGLPAAIAKAHTSLDQHPAAIVGARVQFGPDIPDRLLNPPDDLMDRALAAPHEVFRYLQVFASTGMTVARSVLRAGERWDQTIPVCPDIEFLRRVAAHGPVFMSSEVFLRYRQHADGSSLSGSTHVDKRARGFLITVRRHCTAESAELLRRQGVWILNQLSKNGRSSALFDEMLEEFRVRGWQPRIKPRVRFACRRLLGSAVQRES